MKHRVRPGIPCRRCRGTGKEPDLAAIGHRLREAREARGLGLREFAEVIGCSPAYVTDMEYGRRSLAGPVARRTLTYLGVEL